MTSISCFN